MSFTGRELVQIYQICVYRPNVYVVCVAVVIQHTPTSCVIFSFTGWLHGVVNGRSGIFPSEYVEPVSRTEAIKLSSMVSVPKLTYSLSRLTNSKCVQTQQHCECLRSPFHPWRDFRGRRVHLTSNKHSKNFQKRLNISSRVFRSVNCDTTVRRTVGIDC